MGYKRPVTTRTTYARPERVAGTVGVAAPARTVEQLAQVTKATASAKGIAVSTYFGEQTSPHRLNICLASIYTLIASGFDGKIVVVDDCSITDTHLQRIAQISNKIQIVRRPINNGLSRCKNTSIKSILDCDYLFIADDDVIYNGNWWTPYIEASVLTSIRHFSHYTPQVYHSPRAENIDISGVAIKRHYELNGNFLFMTKSLIHDVGGFKIMPYKYGSEHVNFTHRCLHSHKIPFYCDVANSDQYIQLNKASYDNKSMMPDVQQAQANGPFNSREYVINHIYEPLEE